jgi:PAS domain S-box-containing protein
MAPSKSPLPTLFVSLRWRFVFPLALVVMFIAMIGAYSLAYYFTSSFSATEDQLVLQSAEAVQDRLTELFVALRSEAVRVAYTSGVSTQITSGQAEPLSVILKNNATLAGIDSLIAVNSYGQEIAGILWVQSADAYSVSTNTQLGTEGFVARLLEGDEGSAALIRTAEGWLLYAGVPIVQDYLVTGAVLAGQSLARVAANLKAGSIADLTLYTPDGILAATTYEVDDSSLAALTLDTIVREQTFAARLAVKSSLTLDGRLYHAIHRPLVAGNATLGVLATTVPANVPFASENGRQIVAALAAALAAGAVIASYVGIHATVSRVEKVSATADAIAKGYRYARTHMRPIDEIGLLGQAVDRMADASLAREDQFRAMLTRERRERFYLYNVLDNMPEGVVVLDNGGHMLMVNEKARKLLGSHDAYSQTTQQFQQLIQQNLGTSLTPGIYALGQPQQLSHNGSMLQAQVAAVVSPTRERLGFVILVQDISEQVRREQAREQLLEQLRAEIEQPLYDSVATGARSNSVVVAEFAREISRHAAALQKMIVDMRELTAYGPNNARAMQRILSVETLLWAVANDWRQIAQAANLTLQVTLGRKGLLTLGDEGRLRMAIGNIVDNAIKFTPAGGTLTLEIENTTESAVHLRVRDNGVGISEEDMPHIFVPFYRGTPVDADGRVIRVPGMGQGLAMARQIIEAHGGSIKVKSKAGVGTAVYFSLPLTAGEGFIRPQGEPQLMEGDTVVISAAMAREYEPGK